MNTSQTLFPTARQVIDHTSDLKRKHHGQKINNTFAVQNNDKKKNSFKPHIYALRTYL